MRLPTVRRSGLFTTGRFLAAALIVVAAAGVIAPASQSGAWFTDAKSLAGNSLKSATLGAPQNFRDTWSSSTGHTLTWDSATSQTWATANNVTSGINYRVTRHVGTYPTKDFYTGSATSYTDPNPTGRDLRYSRVSAGQRHTLAIDENGYVWAWGYNGKGAFGDGTTTSTNTPQRTILPSGRTARQIATGNMWSAALLDDGTVWMWGYNVGNLGIGNTDNQVLPQRVIFPNGVEITSLGQILGDSQTMFVIDQNGAVWNWGMNDHGQLGGSSNGNTTTPHVIPDLRASFVSSMGGHVIAMGTDNTVWSWGRGDDGQVGDHRYQDRYSPYRVAMPSTAARIKQVSSGGTYAVALGDDGALWMWGGANVGGDPNPLDPTRISTPRLPNGVQATQVATGPETPSANPSYSTAGVLVGLSNGALLQYEVDDNRGNLRYNGVLDGKFITGLSVGGAERVALTSDQSTSGLYFWSYNDSGEQSAAYPVWSPTVCPYSTRRSGSSCVWDGTLSYSVDYTYGPWLSDWSGLTP